MHCVQMCYKLHNKLNNLVTFSQRPVFDYYISFKNLSMFYFFHCIFVNCFCYIYICLLWLTIVLLLFYDLLFYLFIVSWV